MSYHRPKKGAAKGPRPETIEAVPMWIVAPGGIGHAVRARHPTTAHCGRTDFRGGFFTANTPKRLCRDCASMLKIRQDHPEPRPTPPEETRHSLFQDSDP